MVTDSYDAEFEKRKNHLCSKSGGNPEQVL